MEGRGVMRYASGELYDGEWKSNTPQGRGKLTTRQFVYEGEFQNGKMFGKVHNTKSF